MQSMQWVDNQIKRKSCQDRCAQLVLYAVGMPEVHLLKPAATTVPQSSLNSVMRVVLLQRVDQQVLARNAPLS